MSLLYLMHLVQLKNDLNRKRRRFYNIMNGRRDWARLHPEDKAYDKSVGENRWQHVNFTHMHPAYSKLEAKRGYEQTKLEMKSMTKWMRHVRLSLGAKFRWDNRGAIHSVVHEGTRYYEKDIKRLAASYEADQILLAS